MADETLKLDPTRTAMLIQDLQNDVIIEGGAFADSGAPQHAKEQNVVANVKNLADACAPGGQVIHVWYIVEEGAPGLKLNAPLFNGVKARTALVRGTWGAAPAEGLEPQRGRLRGREDADVAWQGTRLETLLAGLGVDTSSSPAPGRTCRSSTRPAPGRTRASTWSCPRTAARR